MIEENELFSMLDKWNMWTHELETGIERPQYVQEIVSFCQRKEVLVLQGIRRCGKSTIIKQIMKRLTQQGVAKEQLLYLNVEDYRLQGSLELKLFETILKVYRERINTHKKTYFFIDEIQLMPGWERFLRTQYDLGEDIKFLVSGSNSSLLAKELSTLLTGRNLTFQIKPLSYSEYKTFTLQPELEEYLRYGGFPEVVLEKNSTTKRKLLQQYYEDIIYKDIVQRNNIRNSENVMSLARFIIENSGTRLSINKMAKALHMDNKTVDSYIVAMIDAFLLIKVHHFSYSLKKRFDKTTQPKYYCSDNGFFEVSSLQHTKDEGKKFENAVAVYLSAKHKDLAYWLEQSETDFITKTQAINVTTAIKDIPKREFDGLKQFKKKHEQFRLMIVTPEKSYETSEGIDVLSFEELINNTIPS